MTFYSKQSDDGYIYKAKLLDLCHYMLIRSLISLSP
jgi:hypothetical protein